MRNFIDSILLLNEAAAPEEEMFASLENYFERVVANAKEINRFDENTRTARTALDYINDAKTLARDSLFQRRDIRTWVARTLRFHLANELADGVDLPSEMLRLLNKVKGDYVKLVGDQKIEVGSFVYVREFIRQGLRHYLGLPYHKIQNYRFTNQTIPVVQAQMNDLEEEFKTRIRGLVAKREGDEILMEFPDGMVWMLLARGYCDEEAKAMGHCGNAGAKQGDRIISLRKPKAMDEGEVFYEPFLTFILQADGRLGEMKGRTNDKPAARYHDYIEALLRNPIVTGIRGGGYKPENNFALADLPIDRLHDLVDDRPELESGTVTPNEDDELYLKISDKLEWIRIIDDFGKTNEMSALNFSAPYRHALSEVYSLRSKRTRKDGSFAYSPLVIAMVTNQGVVTKLAGRDDSVPSKELQPAVVKFLEQPLISTISRNGGYNPFKVSDLEPEWQDYLTDIKPVLGNISQAYKKTGLTPALQTRIISMLEDFEGEPKVAFNLEWQNSNPDDEQLEMFEHNDQLQVFAWSDVDDFVSDFVTKKSAAYFEDDDFGHYDSHVDDSNVESFFDDLPIVVRVKMIEKARANYYEDNAIDPEDEDYDPDDDYNIPDSDMKMIEEYLPEEWEAMTNACHSGQDAGYQDEVSDAKHKAVMEAAPQYGTIEMSILKSSNGEDYIDWEDPVKLVLKPEEIIKALSEIEDDEYIPDDFIFGDMEIEVNEPHYGFHGFSNEVALDRFWEETTFVRNEFPKKPEIDLTKVTREAKIAKIKEALDLIPDGMMYKRYDLENMDDAKLNTTLTNIIDKYYL